MRAGNAADGAGAAPLLDLGMRQAGYRGRQRTRLQALLAASVANFKRLCVLDAFAAAPEVACAG